MSVLLSADQKIKSKIFNLNTVHILNTIIVIQVVHGFHCGVFSKGRILFEYLIECS